MIFDAAKLTSLNKLIEEEKEFLLLSHVLPDGDSVGSVIAFAEILKGLGKKVRILFRDPVPEIYKFLLGDNIVDNLESFGDTCPRNFVMLDCSDLGRLGEELQDILTNAVNIINIDHHISNDQFGNIAIVNGKAAATCEVLFFLFKKLDLQINKRAAQALYTGIMTDTGGFRYESTSKNSFLAAAELVDLGVELSEIRENVYENTAMPSILILQRALAKLNFSSDGKLSWLYVSAKDMQEVGASGEHCEGIVNYPLSIAGVKMGFFFREMPEGNVKVGLRARKGYNVNQVAQLFNGGGHAQAAGCTLNVSLEEAITKVISTAEKFVEES